MALTTEAIAKVQRRAMHAVHGTGTLVSSADSVSPYHFYAIKAFFLHMAANKGNPDLQFVAYSSANAVASTNGTSLVGGACTLYMWFGKAVRTTGTTASFNWLWDGTAGGGDSDPVGDEIAVHRIKAVGQQFLNVWPNGYTVATDVSIVATTAIDGTTESSAADATDGFIIVGA